MTKSGAGKVKNSLTPMFAIIGAKQRIFSGRSRELPLDEAIKQNPYTKDFEELLSGIDQYIHFSVRVMMRLRDVSCLPLKGYRSRIVRQGLTERVIWVRSKTRGISPLTIFSSKFERDIITRAHFISEDTVIDEEMHLLDVWLNQWENEREQPILNESPTIPKKSAKAKRKDTQSLADFLRPLLKEAKQANVHYRGSTRLPKFARLLLDNMAQTENARVRYDVQLARENTTSRNRPASPTTGFTTISQAERMDTVEQEDENGTGTSKETERAKISLREDKAGPSAALTDINLAMEKQSDLEAFQEQERKQFGHFTNRALPSEDNERWVEDSDGWVTTDDET